MEFEFTDADLEVIEKLKETNLNKDTKIDIMEFVERYKFTKRFYEASGKYIKLTQTNKEGKEKLVMFLKVLRVYEDSDTVTIGADQIISYYYTDDDKLLAYSRVDTRCRKIDEVEEFRYWNTNIRVEIKRDLEYTIDFISMEDYENELVNAVNIN